MGIATCDDIDALVQQVAELTDGTAGPTADVPEFADNNSAISGGLIAGQLYRTGDVLKVVH